MAQSSVASKTYASRVASFANPAAKLLLETMERKKTNLCVSVDVTKKADLLQVVESVGADVCMVKVSILMCRSGESGLMLGPLGLDDKSLNVCLPRCALTQTHIDIVEDFDLDLTEKLWALSTQHDFVIFEDRKFADIGE
jgi:orotidine-5'-phosphate decarboxylase